MAADLSRSSVVAKLTEQIMARAEKAVESASAVGIEDAVRFRILAEEIAKAQHRAGILPEKDKP